LIRFLGSAVTLGSAEHLLTIPSHPCKKLKIFLAQYVRQNCPLQGQTYTTTKLTSISAPASLLVLEKSESLCLDPTEQVLWRVQVVAQLYNKILKT
jgi:hypothetical protein